MSMKLYFSPGACSLCTHIALHESGLDFEPVLASTKTHRLADGTDYHSINPLGYVPLLELADGTRLTEVAAILQYIADQIPASHLAPPAGTLARYQLMAWLNFVATELHKGFSPLFSKDTPDNYKPITKEHLMQRLAWVDAQLQDRPFLMGETFSVADLYLFNISNWAHLVGLKLTDFSNLLAFRTRVGERPAVRAAMRAEGLLK
jgi:glutathione S-transferase